MNKKRGALQISFAWIFAIIVGVFILFLAIYGVVKFIGLEQTSSDVEIAKQIGVLLNPLETSFQSAQSTSMNLPVETRIYNRCSNFGSFGEQKIKVTQKSFGKWSDTNTDVEFLNKYIFSEEYVEGKKFYLFSKPFDFPFKVADLIYMTSASKEYCFDEPSNDIEDEISALGQKNLLLECTENSVKICFEDKGGCDVVVSENGKYVEKNEEKVYFEGDALMYAGIFSDKEVYECQLKRLMQRVENLALLYKDKETFISQKCEAGLSADLLGLNDLAEGLENSEELYLINNLVEDIQEKNDGGVCGLW